MDGRWLDRMGDGPHTEHLRTDSCQLRSHCNRQVGLFKPASGCGEGDEIKACQLIIEMVGGNHVYCVGTSLRTTHYP